MSELVPCDSCDGNGFKRASCGCGDLCTHVSPFGVPSPTPGLYQKFWVRRTDGSSCRGGKHAECEYFVLDWEHDKFAPVAARAYAAACEEEYPELARDLLARAIAAERARAA